jgi:hypothetical protein
MNKFNLVKKEDATFRARPLPEWLDLLANVKQTKDGVTTAELVEITGASKQCILRILNELSAPFDYRTIGKQKHSVFKTEELREIAKLYREGYCWRSRS